jgi:hypothetical protein
MWGGSTRVPACRWAPVSWHHISKAAKIRTAQVQSTLELPLDLKEDVPTASYS